MKVLQINAVYKTGSTGRNVYELHTAMQNIGIESFVASTHMNDIDNNVYQIGSPIDWKLHGILSRISGLQGYFSTKATKELLKFMDDIKPDIVHINNLHANYINLSLLFSYLERNDISTVITLHDCWFYTGKCTHYTVDNCFRWKTGCHNCPRLKVDNKSWFFDRTSKMWMDKKNWYNSISRLAVVGVSEWISNEAKQSILNSALIVKRVYNWIDLDVFKPIKSTILSNIENKFIILGVSSRWSNKKGLDYFIELASILKKDEVIVLVGEMPSIALPDNIIHVDATNNLQELVEYYCSADVFLQLSEEESFGKVVAEALACGTPVVTVNSTANKELVPCSCGIVVDEMNCESIYNAVEHIRINGKLSFKNECRKFAEENFEMNKCVKEYIDIYTELMVKRN